MSSLKLQKISNEAWIVIQNGEKLGLLNQNVQQRYTFVDKSRVIEFNTKDDLESFFGEDNIFRKEDVTPIVKSGTFYIKGYVVSYDSPVPVDVDDPAYRPDLPLFKKTEIGNVHYCAGWYAINFDQAWKAGNCPKLVTLMKYGYHGPFKDQSQVKALIKTLNKEKRREESGKVSQTDSAS